MMGLPNGIIYSPLMPFDGDAGLDETALSHQVEFLIGQGAAGLCSFIHGGEMFNLRGQERHRAMEIMAEAAAGRVPLFAHVSTSATHMSAELALHAQKLGAQGVLLSKPYYWRLSEKEQLSHFTTVAEAIDVDLFIYNVPRYSDNVGVSIPVVTECLEAIPNFGGVVENSLNYLYLSQLYSLFEGTKARLTTDTAYLLPTSQIGVTSWFSPLGTVAPGMLSELLAAIQSGDMAQAAVLQHKVSRIVSLLGDMSPPHLKAASEIAGRTLGIPRRPLRQLKSEEMSRMRTGLESYLPASDMVGW